MKAWKMALALLTATLVLAPLSPPATAQEILVGVSSQVFPDDMPAKIAEKNGYYPPGVRNSPLSCSLSNDHLIGGRYGASYCNARAWSATHRRDACLTFFAPTNHFYSWVGVWNIKTPDERPLTWSDIAKAVKAPDARMVVSQLGQVLHLGMQKEVENGLGLWVRDTRFYQQPHVVNKGSVARAKFALDEGAIMTALSPPDALYAKHAQGLHLMRAPGKDLPFTLGPALGLVARCEDTQPSSSSYATLQGIQKAIEKAIVWIAEPENKPEVLRFIKEEAVIKTGAHEKYGKDFLGRGYKNGPPALDQIAEGYYQAVVAANPTRVENGRRDVVRASKQDVADMLELTFGKKVPEDEQCVYVNLDLKPCPAAKGWAKK